MSQTETQKPREPDKGPPESEIQAPQQGAQLLQNRLNLAFSCAEDRVEAAGEIALVSPFASATMRQTDGLKTLIDQIQGADRMTSARGLGNEITHLCELLAAREAEARHAASEVENRFESLADAVAVIGGHLASQREEIQNDKMIIQALSEDIKRLNAVTQANRAENAELRAMILSMNAALQKELTPLQESGVLLSDEIGKISGRIAQVEDSAAALKQNAVSSNDEVGRIIKRIAGVEDGVEILTHGLDEVAQTKESVNELTNFGHQAVKRMDLLTSGLDAANTQIRALRRASEQVATGLRAALGR